jgi:hypothetical protein
MGIAQMRAIFFFFVILISSLLVVGCVQQSSTAEKKNTSIVLTPQSISGVPDTTQLPDAHPGIIPRYRTGDIIDFSKNIEKVPHLIILDYNNKTDMYQYDIIFRNDNKSWGYRLYPETRWDSVESIEKNEPYLITHINITDLETRFQSREIFEKTH